MTVAAKYVVAFCGGVVTLAAFVGVIWWLVKPRVVEWFEATLVKPVRETHHQVTVNHHSSKEPTVLDRIDTVQRKVDEVAQANRVQDRKIDGVQRDVTALTVVFDAHLRGGDVGDEPDLS